jgi:hypothetical protein
MLILLLLQAAAGQAPDIELNLHATARSVRIERKGEARLDVRGEGPGNSAEARVEPKAQGRSKLRNVTVDIHAKASVQDGVKLGSQVETGAPQ